MTDAEARARELLTFAEGFTAAGGGNEELARRARVAARDVLELAETLQHERSARLAIQDAYERCLAILGRQADEAAAREALDPETEIPF